MYKWLERRCEKILVSTWISARNLAFPAFILPIVCSMCENLHYDQSAYFKELHNDQGYNWSTTYRVGAALVSTITSYIILIIYTSQGGVLTIHLTCMGLWHGMITTTPTSLLVSSFATPITVMAASKKHLRHKITDGSRNIKNNIVWPVQWGMVLGSAKKLGTSLNTSHVQQYKYIYSVLHLEPG